jgi:hypothetical protein
MFGLTNINNMLDNEFDSWFDIPTYTNKQEFTDKEDAIGCFKFCFEDTYKNGDRCLCGHTEDLCDTENLIEMSVYLADRYAQEDVIPDISITETNNKSRSSLMIEEIIHEYIYYYLKETKYPEFIQQIENYWINNNNLPPAQ